ncbi:MAG: hypothetical protein ACYCPT_02010 [Acidimicrobiales bacterium]
MELVFVCMCDDGACYADPETGDEHLLSSYAGQVIDVTPMAPSSKHMVGFCFGISCGVGAVQCGAGAVKCLSCGNYGGALEKGFGAVYHGFQAEQKVQAVVCGHGSGGSLCGTNVSFPVAERYETKCLLSARAGKQQTIKVYDRRGYPCWRKAMELQFPRGSRPTRAQVCAYRAAHPPPAGNTIVVQGTWDSTGRSVLVPYTSALDPYVAAMKAGAGNFYVEPQTGSGNAYVPPHYIAGYKGINAPSACSPALAGGSTSGQITSAQQALAAIVAELAAKYQITA